MQDFDAKCQAIVSLLGSVFAHLDYVPGAQQTARQEWISEPSPLDPPAQPKPVYDLGCMGRCFTCLIAYTVGKRPACPPDEKWAREYEQLRRRYRIRDVEESLLRLSWEENPLAQAVWAVHVEPWPDPRTEPIGMEAKAERARLAEQGVWWLAEDIEGDVLAYGEKVETLDNEIRRMKADGYTYKGIKRELRCGSDRIRRVLHGETVRCG
jgi:hypothetical protein